MANLGVALREIHQLFSVGTVASQPDGLLLDRFARGRDEAAFAALVERHGPMVLAVCRSVLKDEHAAEDAFQAAFLVLAKKAGAIRSGETLAAWLCRVAFRIAVQAAREHVRRRRMEARATAAPREARVHPGPDVLTALHEELDRLPECLRAPVVLCHLEGRTYDEAARSLRVPSTTIRGRLVRARKRLAASLTRRGVAGAGASLAAALGARSATAAVPESLARATIRAATGGGAASAVAAGLATGHLRMSVATAAIAWSAVLALVAGLAGTADVVRAKADAPPPRASTTPPPASRRPRPVEAHPAPIPPAPGPRQDNAIEIQGRVLGPDGTPVSGASVKTAFATRGRHEPAETLADGHGQFRLKIPRSTRDLLLKEGGDRKPRLAASAPGFGLSSCEVDLRDPGEATIRLTEAGPPLEGRVLGLEGRPVAGARVKARRVWAAEGGDLGPWAARLKSGEARGAYEDLKVLAGEAETSSGPDGRFRLEGLGAERVVDLVVSGPTIATGRVLATNRAGPELRLVLEEFRGTETHVVHPPGFDHVSPPMKAVEGVVRDKDTGRPIAGVNVQGAVYDSHSLIPNPDVSTLTDAEGRYRLAGLARSGAYRVFVSPGPGLPYARATFRAPAETPALEPVRFDVALKRGVLVKGRLLDKATGKPVPIERVNTFSFADNPQVAEYPGYKDGSMTYGIPDAEGGFEVVALPGRGLLGVRAASYGYLKPRAVEKIEGYDPKSGRFDNAAPRMIPIVNYHAFVETNFAPGTETATLDLVADPGRTVMLSAVDPEGRPLGDTVVTGAEGILGDKKGVPQSSPEIEVRSLDPSEPRRVTVRHPGRKLVGSVVLKGDERGPVTLRLQSWAELEGRIVDEEGTPRPKLTLSAGSSRVKRPLEEIDVLPMSDVAPGIALDQDGRFRVVGLVPGLSYAANAMERGFLVIGHVFEEVRMAPGEVKQLGDLEVTPYRTGD